VTAEIVPNDIHDEQFQEKNNSLRKVIQNDHLSILIFIVIVNDYLTIVPEAIEDTVYRCSSKVIDDADSFHLRLTDECFLLFLQLTKLQKG